jgi:hypothetical protein
MTSTDQTINISSENIYSNCDLKCSYNYKYTQSNSIATNKGVYISLTYDKGTSSPVNYNSQKYYVSEITIYNNSLHSFNGNIVNSEIIIEHAPEMGGDLLYVCIPIISSTNTTDASTLLSDIIQIVSSNAPNEGETSSLNISNFDLNNIVPKKPFYAYTGTSGLKGQVIVYGMNYAIPLNETSLTNLTKIIQPYPLPLSGGNLFFNKIGPNNIQLNDGIYISCQPTGSSDDEINVTYTKSSSSQSVNNDFVPIFNKSVKIVIGCLLVLLIFALISRGYIYFTK